MLFGAFVIFFWALVIYAASITFFNMYLDIRRSNLIQNQRETGRALVNELVGKLLYFQDFPRQLRNEIELIQSTNKEYYAKQNLHIV